MTEQQTTQAHQCEWDYNVIPGKAYCRSCKTTQADEFDYPSHTDGWEADPQPSTPRRTPLESDTTHDGRQYPQDYCLGDFGAYGQCIRRPGHSGDCQDAHGWRFQGRREAAEQAQPETPVARVTPGAAEFVGYPRSQSYVWGEFAYLAVEAGGYGDISAVSPYDGRRITVFGAFADGGTPYDALRALIDQMEQVHFLPGA